MPLVAPSDYEIQLGQVVTTEEATTLLGIGSVGDVSALRTLTHPDSSVLPPLTYWGNPHITSNLLNEVLPAPIASVVRTLSTSVVTRFEGKLGDVVCEETWNGSPNRAAAMPTYFLAQLYNYLINPPVIDLSGQEYIVWRPRDASDKAYNVQFYKMVVGGGDQQKVFHLRDFRLPAPPTIEDGLQGFDVDPTGLIDQTVTVSLHVVSEFTE